jgi:hypothetical protein
MVSFDATPTPLVLNVASNLLRVEHAMAALPPNIPVPSVANVSEHLQDMAQEVIGEHLEEQGEEEHLPDDTPESKDAEVERDNNNNKEGGADAVTYPTAKCGGKQSSQSV